MSETKTDERKSSADIKREIAEAQKAAKDSVVPLTNQVAAEINAAGPSTPEAPTLKVEGKADLLNGAPKAVESGKSSKDGDLLAWANKRGIDWTTETSILEALRKSDQAFHAKRQAEKAREQETRIAPAYTPPPAPVYAPAPTHALPMVPNRAALEALGRQYGLLPEEVEKLMAFNRDFYEVASRSERERYNRELEAIRTENEKNSVFRELSSDPVFKNPVVGEEYHRVVEEMQASDPRAFENPSAYKRAFELAVFNLGRRNLEGRPLQEGVPPVAMPTTPPRPLGNGSGGGAVANENGIDPKAFAAASLDEKRKALEAMGLRPSY